MMSETPVEELRRVSLREHLDELFRRLSLALGGPVVIALPAATLATVMLAPAGTPHQSLISSEGFLWGILAGLFVLHYFLLVEVMGYMMPALYSHERRMMIIPGMWIAAVPVIALFLMWVHVRVLGTIGLAQMRAWVARYYFMAGTVPLALYLPRQARRASLPVYIFGVVVACLFPDHFCDTLLVSMYMVIFIAWILALLAWGVTRWNE